MRKIGVLTLPIHTNYGGILQAYALMVVLKNLGYDPLFIDRRLNISIKGRAKKLVLETLMLHKNTNLKFEQFISKYITPKSEQFFTDKKLIDGIQKYDLDTFIVGSDQVWRKEYSGKIFYNYFLDFVENNNLLKKISYAASFGKEEDNLNEKDFYRCKELLKKFNHISVREDSAVNFCYEKFDVQATHVLDPTLLLNKKDYLEAFNLKENNDLKDKNLLVYYLDVTTDKIKLVENISKLNDYKVINVDTHKIKDKISVESWIDGFNKSSFVITDSFHACIFAILFKKPFLVVGNKDRGLSRFQSLLSTFNLQSCLIIDQNVDEILDNKIDWDEVYSILNINRKNSFEFLKQALN